MMLCLERTSGAGLRGLNYHAVAFSEPLILAPWVAVLRRTSR